MKTFAVTVRRLVLEEAVFTIEGESEEEARELSYVPLHPNNYAEYDLHWEEVKVESSWVHAVKEE